MGRWTGWIWSGDGHSSRSVGQTSEKGDGLWEMAVISLRPRSLQSLKIHVGIHVHEIHTQEVGNRNPWRAGRVHERTVMIVFLEVVRSSFPVSAWNFTCACSSCYESKPILLTELVESAEHRAQECSRSNASCTISGCRSLHRLEASNGSWAMHLRCVCLLYRHTSCICRLSVLITLHTAMEKLDSCKLAAL